MAIGLDRSAGYAFTGSTGVFNGVSGAQIGQSVKLYIVAAGVNLSAEDDAANEAFEAIIQAFPPVLAYYAHATTGAISLICDGVNAPAASVLQTALQAIAATKGAVNLSSATVTDGTSFVVS
jgi:hypothetical protein